jgi:hypothetical protein
MLKHQPVARSAQSAMLKYAEIGKSTCKMHWAMTNNWCRKVLSKKERRAYINAVLCLRKKPSKADPSFAPGARSRYDDFVAVHINQTRSIHGTVGSRPS